MAIPKFDETMLPLLKRLTDQKTRNLREVSSELEENFDLTQ